MTFFLIQFAFKLKWNAISNRDISIGAFALKVLDDFSFLHSENKFREWTSSASASAFSKEHSLFEKKAKQLKYLIEIVWSTSVLIIKAQRIYSTSTLFECILYYIFFCSKQFQT